jgi:hypothetical protein
VPAAIDPKPDPQILAGSRLCWAASSFIGFVAARAPCDPRLAGGCPALLIKFEFQLGDRGHDAGDGAPRRGARVHAFPHGPHVDATAGQLMESRGDVATERPSRSTATTTR